MSNIPYFEDEDSGLRPGLPIVERESIEAIVYDRAKGKVICLDWVKFGWKTFIIGGIEPGETPECAALREIIEETGYKNLHLIADLGKIRSGYFAAHKNENRISNATGLLFELVDDECEEVDQTDLPHLFHWVDINAVGEYVTLTSHKYQWGIAKKYL